MVRRLKRRVRVLTAQKRRPVHELRAARATVHAKSSSLTHAAPPSTIQVAS